MLEAQINHQQHGYKNGHQLLASSIKLSRADQDVVDRLSDLAGSLRPGETFAPYLTGYPLPSRKYYVLARTSQDLDAPRSGCVLTHSLFVPMDLWEAEPCVASLVAMLRPVERKIGIEAPLVLSLQRKLLPPVGDPRVSELVEALFLENRQSIVMFNVHEAEIIIERLLTALWPGLRGKFCVCTFSLAPRTFGGREFDLLFAPKSARSRFTEWKGRRIETAITTPITARHRWTDSITQKIFQSDEPSLLTSDFLGVLQHDDRGDESALRLSLLWSELLEKSETSQNAILGMLDILNSQNKAFGNTLIQITPFIERGIRLAWSSLQSSETWEFMVTLLGKLSVRQLPTGILRQLSRTSAILAKNEPEIALEFLKCHDDENKLVPPILLSGLARGLTRSPIIDSIADGILQLRPVTSLRLIAFSTSFSKFVIRKTTVESSVDWAYALNVILDTTDNDLRSRARRNIIPQLDNPSQAPLLTKLLKDIDSRSLMSVVSRIWARTHFEIEEFDEPLCHSARGKERMASLRTAILSVDETTASNRFLLGTLQPTMPDIEWLCHSTNIKHERARNILKILLSRADNHSLESIANSAETRGIILEILLTDIKPVAAELARVLILGQIPIRQLLEIGLQVLPHTKGTIHTDLVLILLSRGLNEANTIDDELLEKTLIIASKKVKPYQLIVMAIPSKGAAARISSNVLLLNGVKATLRKGILAKVDEMTARLTHRGIKDFKGFEESAIIAWASMLKDSGVINKDAQLRAAGAVLPYALRLLKAPVSPLIVVAFPVIYSELRTGKERPGLFDRFLFTDWDRCKIARRDLVNAYMSSSWPPADLLLSATLADDAEKILKRVARHPNGEQYIAAIENDLKRLPHATKKELAIALTTFRSSILSSEYYEK